MTTKASSMMAPTTLTTSIDSVTSSVLCSMLNDNFLLTPELNSLLLHQLNSHHDLPSDPTTIAAATNTSEDGSPATTDANIITNSTILDEQLSQFLSQNSLEQLQRAIVEKRLGTPELVKLLDYARFAKSLGWISSADQKNNHQNYFEVNDVGDDGEVGDDAMSSTINTKVLDIEIRMEEWKTYCVVAIEQSLLRDVLKKDSRSDGCVGRGLGFMWVHDEAWARERFLEDGSGLPSAEHDNKANKKDRNISVFAVNSWAKANSSRPST
ncbi:hypothetical protein ACHAXS_004788 [Conticribra weissflogii]